MIFVGMFQGECGDCHEPMSCTPLKAPPPVIVIQVEHNHHHPGEADVELCKVLERLQEVLLLPSLFITVA